MAKIKDTEIRLIPLIGGGIEMIRNNILFYSLAIVTLACFLIPTAQSQQLSNYDRDRVLTMLEDVSKDIQKHYYDPQLHGVDWAATIRDAQQKIRSSNSLAMALAHVAQALVSLDDSHTFFLPPARPYIHDYGYRVKMIGDKCFVIQVRPGSDAEAKRLTAGDELVTLDGFAPQRDNFWKMQYRFNVLRPQPGLALVLRDPQGRQSQLAIKAKFREVPRVRDVTGGGIWDVVRDSENAEHMMRPRWANLGDAVSILKFPEFIFDQSAVDDMIAKARKRPALILDLRGNPGGAVDTLKTLLGGLFEKDIKIGDRKGRKELKPEVAKSWKHGVFTGKLVVLVDSDSASAAELFARIIQLEKRGVVMGDHTSGSVMEAKHYEYSQGSDVKIFYGASITEEDVIMTDGNSLEHKGVVPDEVMIPTAADLAAGGDPVLSHAVASLGSTLTPEDAGKLFPYEWPKQ
jgi:C-terminal processing protease CtpA/Prc